VTAHEPARLFLPGFAAPVSLYARGLPDGWTPLEPPALRQARDLDAYVGWLVREVERRPGPVRLAGHSMGGALAVLAAAAVPERVAGLTLVSPAGLPLTKPVWESVTDFGGQLRAGLIPLREVAASALQTVRAPAAAVRVARRLRALDLTRELELVRAARIPASVVACTTDTLVTADHCRRIAAMLGAQYRELRLTGGHMWMLSAWPVLADELGS
jgi:pimeloyl-ACP methyl ester carboxylesterase